MEEKTYKLLGGSGALNIAVGAVACGSPAYRRSGMR